jgi:iron complex outermembrane receptor protein
MSIYSRLVVGAFFVFLPMALFAQIDLELQTNVQSDDFISDRYAIGYRVGIDFEEVRLENFSGKPDILSPSVSSRASGSTGQVSTVAIDGGRSENTKLAFDGVVIDLAQNHSTDFSLLPFEFAQSAEVYKNNLAPIGIKASAGLVNLNSPNPFDETKRLKLYLGSFQSYGISAHYSKRVNRDAFLIGGTLSVASNRFEYITRFGETNIAENLDYIKYSVIGKWNGGNWDANLFHTGKFAGAGNRYGGKPRQTDFLSSLSFKARLGKFDAKTGYINWYNSFSNSAPVITDTHINHSINAEISRKMEFQNLISLLAIKSRTYIVESTQTGLNTDKELSLVGEAIWRKGLIELGGAINSLYSFSSGFYPIPSISAAIIPIETLRFSAEVSRQFRIPSFNDLYWQFDGFSKGNPDLLPEDGIKIQTASIWTPLPFILSMSFIYGSFENQIIWSPDSSGVWTAENIGRSHSIIASFSAKYMEFIGKLLFEISAGISYNNSVDNDKDSPYYGKNLIYTPRLKANTILRASYNQIWIMETRLRYTGERFTTRLNTVSLPEYFILDTYLRYRFLFVEINNILNRSYYEQEGYPMMGINFKAGMEINL